MKTCKYGCGGKMKSGGKVAAVKKMQKGGKTTSFTEDISKGLDNVFRKTYPFNVPHDKVTKALKYVDDTITNTDQKQPDWYNSLKAKVKKTMHVPDKKQKGGPVRPVKPGVKQDSFKELQGKVHSDIKKRTGKTAPMSKMAKGGSSKGPCPGINKCWNGKECINCTSAVAGLTASISGVTGVAGKMISDYSKKRKAIKEIKKSNPAMTTKEARKQLASKDTEEKRRGGATKKYQAGGSTIVGMPKYSNNPRSNAGRILQSGGSFAPNRAVQASCKGGMVRDANGKCVMSRTFKKGGFPDLNKDGKVTRADILKGRGVIKKLGGAKKR
jgi:hypothetical protein